ARSLWKQKRQADESRARSTPCSHAPNRQLRKVAAHCSVRGPVTATVRNDYECRLRRILEGASRPRTNATSPDDQALGKGRAPNPALDRAAPAGATPQPRTQDTFSCPHCVPTRRSRRSRQRRPTRTRRQPHEESADKIPAVQTFEQATPAPGRILKRRIGPRYLCHISPLPAVPKVSSDTFFVARGKQTPPTTSLFDNR